MGKSAKKSATKVEATPAVVAQETKSMKKGKRDAEEIVEKKVVSSKKQKVVNGGVTQAVEKRRLKLRPKRRTLRNRKAALLKKVHQSLMKNQRRLWLQPRRQPLW